MKFYHFIHVAVFSANLNFQAWIWLLWLSFYFVLYMGRVSNLDFAVNET